MDVSVTYFENILKTLPVSYYTGRDILVEVSTVADTSYYVPMEDRIVVSYAGMKNMLDELPEDDERLELHIRTVLYHEISHAILTPQNLITSKDSKLIADINNIFEDERIETLLRTFYYGVNFKKTIFQLNHYHGAKPKDVMQAFYFTVRFRKGQEVHLNRVNRMINDYRDLKNSLDEDYQDPYILDQYRRAIWKLFHDIAKDWLEENQKDKLEEKADSKFGKKYDSLDSDGKADVIDSIINDTADELDKTAEGLAGGKGIKPGEGKGISARPAHGTGSAESPTENVDPSEVEEGVNVEQDEEMEAEAEQQQDYVDESRNVQKMLDTALNKFVDVKLTEQIAMIFENFTSRAKNNRAAISRYSGTLNPRSVATRTDWRIFDYKSDLGPIHGFSKLHLNLFIDTSGSYWNNEKQTNTILKSLDTLEKKYPFFEFDLVTCQVSETLRNKRERYIKAQGGNDLDDKIWGIYKQLQKTDSFNYNIVLFDGEAFTDSRGYREQHKKNFGVFNNSKCSIISDKDNKVAIEKYAPLAHKIIVDGRASGGKSYSSLLYENIISALTRVLL